MKSSTDIVGHIDKLIDAALQRPAMYASTPHALEEILAQLDELREFILSDDPKPNKEVRSSYTQFLSAQGYGVGSYCRRHAPFPEITEKERDLFFQLCGFWKQYLQTRRA